MTEQYTISDWTLILQLLMSYFYFESSMELRRKINKNFLIYKRIKRKLFAVIDKNYLTVGKKWYSESKKFISIVEWVNIKTSSLYYHTYKRFNKIGDI